MLELTIMEQELYDEEKEEFITSQGVTVQFEHSLLSVSKWESKFEKPFLDKTPKTNAEMEFYIRCMFLPRGEFSLGLEDFPDRMLTINDLTKINDYINAPNSATTFGEMPETNKGRGERITSELIYYWMTALQIPFECERWHLNRLFSLIRIANDKNKEAQGGAKKTKMSRAEQARARAELNAKRKADYNTTG